MQYIITINQQAGHQLGLSLKESALLDLFSKLSTWADAKCFQDGVFYYIAYSAIVKQLPMVFQKENTVYKHLVSLRQKGLILQRKTGSTQKNYICLTQKAKNLFRVGKKSEPMRGSEKNPSGVGKKSEPLKGSLVPKNQTNSLRGSEKNPTNNNTNTNDTILIDNPAFEYLKQNHRIELDAWLMNNKSSIPNFKKFIEFFEIQVYAENIKYECHTLIGRLRKLKFNWRDRDTLSQNDEPIKKAVVIR